MHKLYVMHKSHRAICFYPEYRTILKGGGISAASVAVPYAQLSLASLFLFLCSFLVCVGGSSCR